MSLTHKACIVNSAEFKQDQTTCLYIKAANIYMHLEIREILYSNPGDIFRF